MFMTAKIALATAVLAGSVATTPVARVDSDAPAPALTESQGQDQDNGRGQGDYVDAVLDLLGVNRGEMVSHLRTGGTLAELAEANGSSGQAVVDTLVAVADAKIDEAVVAGRIDEDQAAELHDRAVERATDVVYSTHDGPRNGPNQGVNTDFRQLVIDTSIEFLGVNQGQVVSHLRTGGTLAELADESGSSGPELEAALVAEVEMRLDEAVANSQITEERAADLLARATTHIGEIVYMVHTPGNGNGNNR